MKANNMILVFLMAFSAISCSVQNEISTNEFKKLPLNFNAKFFDKLDTIKNDYDSKIYTKSFVKLFTNKEDVDYAKPIILKLEEDKLFLHFSDLHQKEFVLQFYGKLHNKKFVFYTNYKTINFPVVLMTKQMERFKLYVSDSNELIFEKYNVNEGMFLVFGAGNSYGEMFKFKIITNE